MHIPRLVLAGTHSGVGKTTVTLGLLAALNRRGLRVQPFKVGPDYIDPGLHRAAAHCVSHNLDSWMGSPAQVRQLFIRRAAGSDLAVVEGVMGLYDGVRGRGEAGSTAQVAKIIQAPVVLIFPAKGLARSAIALISGYRSFDPRVQIGGVIANGVGSDRHREFLREVVEGELSLPLLGALSHRQEIVMPQRHLGLLPAVENKELNRTLEQLARVAEEQLDIDKIIDLAQKAPLLEDGPGLPCTRPVPRVRLAVARDEAFNFYYDDSLDYLTESGAAIVPFSPLRDAQLPPDIDGIYIGGGFPEQFLPELAANQLIKQQIIAAHQSGMPIYAECGGLMYLCQGICSLSGEEFPGVGLVPARVKMERKLAALGYVRARLVKPTLLGEPGLELRGHEFHWSTISALSPADAAYQLSGGRGTEERPEGYAKANLLASYVHLHFRYNPTAAGNFLAQCTRYGQVRRTKHG